MQHVPRLACLRKIQSGSLSASRYSTCKFTLRTTERWQRSLSDILPADQPKWGGHLFNGVLQVLDSAPGLVDALPHSLRRARYQQTDEWKGAWSRGNESWVVNLFRPATCVGEGPFRWRESGTILLASATLSLHQPKNRVGGAWYVKDSGW